MERKKIYNCFVCGGDGKETCSNPDHGFIDGIGGETSRLGCPCCGHDPYYKVPNGGDCEACSGDGRISESEFETLADEYGYDNEPELCI